MTVEFFIAISGAIFTLWAFWASLWAYWAGRHKDAQYLVLLAIFSVLI